MLISRVTDESAGRGEPAAADIARNCQTASELFELMTKDHDFEAGDDPLTASDLVLLYKNIDLGHQLMSTVRANQYVENVYHGEPETDSDLSECCSSEELRNIMMVNKERIDLLTNQGSFKSLSHKLGDMEMQVSNITTDLYEDRHYLYKDPYIKEQLQSLQILSKATEIDTGMLPTSLLDYICSKNVENNSNFYMDNVITYVTHTIDQLKRISNGDYLPDRVKEKWRESDQKMQNASKNLAKSISMPLQVQKAAGPTWDDIVRTEIDLRSLVKILEQNVVLGVPKMICGSYKFFSKFQNDQLVIKCEGKKCIAGSQAKPCVEVALRVHSAPTSQVDSSLSPVMLLPMSQITEKDGPEILPLEYQDPVQTALSPKIVELSEQDHVSEKRSWSIKSDEFSSLCSVTDDKDDDDVKGEELSSPRSAHQPGSPESISQMLNTATRVVCAEAASDHATPNDLHVSMIKLPEESIADTFYSKTKKKSPDRIRVKSPYENKSHILEERRRRKLLEVRERRERRKLASNDNNKVKKHKPSPQAVSSVTKLSITNKSFYNSIYGRNGNGENANRISATAIRTRKTTQKTDGIIQEIDLESEADVEEIGDVPNIIIKKKLCADHFLDDTETEMSYLQSKHDSAFMRISTSTSVVSNESESNLFMQSDCSSSLKCLKVDEVESETVLDKLRQEHETEVTIKAQVALNKNPANTPKGDSDKTSAVECRRSLEKIYTLMEKLHQIEINETSKKKATATESRGSGSESIVSLKRRVSFSNPKLEKHPNETHRPKDDGIPTAAVPKFVISAKLQTVKADDKKERKAKTPRVKTISENPLKAISQLLHEFDNVQKSRPKIADPRLINRSMSTENTEQPVRQKRRSQISSPLKEDAPKVTAKVKTRFGREERPEVKPQVLDKKIIDLIDEVKEARGEAVRGPPRFSSRLNALAQPKRAYMQALAEDLPRRQTSERAPRPSSHTPRARRRGEGRASPVSVRAPHSSLERAAKPCRPVSPEPADFASLAVAAVNALHTLKKSAPAPAGAGASAGRRGAERAGPARAPRAPSDLELCTSSITSFPTMEDDALRSTAIGTELHRMVSAILQTHIETSQDPSPPAASHQSEKQIVTVVKEIFQNSEAADKSSSGNESTDYQEPNEAASVGNYSTELQMLEHALHRTISSGTFTGRLRVNKLTLSPRPSLQQVVMHQSGDTTLVLKSNFNQNIQVTCKSDKDLMRLLSTTRLSSLSQFPLQISTVGYAFPAFQCELKKITPRMSDNTLSREAGTSCTVTELPETTIVETKDKTSKSCQCLISEPTKAECVAAVCTTENVETGPNHESTVSVSPTSPTTTENRDEALNDKENNILPDYTASFDILVGLLNEIHKITCGCDATSSETTESESQGFSSRGNSEVQSCMRSGDMNANCASLIKTNCRESSDDRFGIFVPETKSVSAEALEQKPACEDKEVLARLVDTDYTSASTSGPGLLRDANAFSSTNERMPTCSVAALTHSEYCDIGCNTSTQPGNKITEAEIEANRTVKSLVPYYNNMIKKESVPSENVVALKNTSSCGVMVKIPIQKNKKVSKKCGEVDTLCSKKDVKELCLNTIDFDSTLRVKRDILVTFYSILVLTVFAALAFPEMLQYA